MYLSTFILNVVYIFVHYDCEFYKRETYQAKISFAFFFRFLIEPNEVSTTLAFSFY